MSWIETCCDAHRSYSRSSGSTSLTFVLHDSSATPAGSAVAFRPAAKSAMSSATAAAVNAFDMDAMFTGVFRPLS
jgi:hypothetical protein